MRDEVVNLIRLGRFTWCEFARYFPDSPSLPKLRPTEIELTFDEMADRWLGAVRPEIAATTWDEYKNTLNNYWRPSFGEQWIRAITYEDLVLEIADFPPLAAKTFNNAMTPLRGIWAMALKMRKVDTNITLDIGSRKGQKPVPDPLELDEVTRVLQQLREHADETWWNYFTLAFFTGLRPSESIALRWSRCDFRREQIRVDSARVRHRDKGTKTLVVRDVDLQGPALAALQRQRRLTRACGDMVFINPKSGKRIDDTGEPLEIWREALGKAGIRERDARQTRHTYATLGLHAGMNPGYLSRQMGHKNAKMFFEVYSKWIDGSANQAEKDKMRRLLAKGCDAEKTPANCNVESHRGRAFGHVLG